MGLKVYADRLSQPSRAVLIFCKINGIEFEEVLVELAKRQHRTPEFKEINPMGQVPVIVDGRYTIFESHAILSYLASVFPGIPDHWYPADTFSRAKVNSVLDWHHSNLRRGAATYIQNTVLGPLLGIPTSTQVAKEAEILLLSSFTKLESIWLKGNAKFLLGNSKPSIADLSLVCEIMQLQLLDEEDYERTLGPHTKILQWIDNVKHATSPHFDEVHGMLYKLKARLQSKKLPAKL